METPNLDVLLKNEEYARSLVARALSEYAALKQLSEDLTLLITKPADERNFILRRDSLGAWSLLVVGTATREPRRLLLGCGQDGEPLLTEEARKELADG